MDTHFAKKLKTLKAARNLSVQELAQKAGVSGGLISGIIHGYRIIGEKTARKIGGALNLQDQELEDFIHLALNNGCSEKVLNSSKGFPSQVINLVAGKLNASGIDADMITGCFNRSDTTALHLTDGTSAYIHVEVTIR